ncbi:hypothetical protein [Stenotrophomonas cyclobalanopsidis]|uniref:hypothetical protein n=1 Tax=Stenotrophomonas cyclobalanopsidis TaxID=2771362 RepID=UPI00345F2C65
MSPEKLPEKLTGSTLKRAPPAGRLNQRQFMVVALSHRLGNVAACSFVVAIRGAAMFQAVQCKALALGYHADADRFGYESLPGTVEGGFGDWLAASLH